MVTLALDWQRYKQICDRPYVFSRWMLEQTGELIDPPLSTILNAVLDGAPLVKPADHKGTEATDMFELALSAEQVRSVQSAIRIAADLGRTSSATRRRGLGGFQEAWDEYADYLAGSGPASGEAD